LVVEVVEGEQVDEARSMLELPVVVK